MRARSYQFEFCWSHLFVPHRRHWIGSNDQHLMNCYNQDIAIITYCFLTLGDLSDIEKYRRRTCYSRSHMLAWINFCLILRLHTLSLVLHQLWEKDFLSMPQIVSKLQKYQGIIQIRNMWLTSFAKFVSSFGINHNLLICNYKCTCKPIDNQ